MTLRIRSLGQPADRRAVRHPAPLTAGILVYDRCMARLRTNIEIEDDYVQTIMSRYGIRTKTEAVEIALRHLAGQPMTRVEALRMRGAHAIDILPADAGPGHNT